ncbi:hypothetical protein GGR95_003333 [Sulfitobacter undariae]|uniref:Oxidoreductase molybdopterin-binding domain-containing protein n=1 Tax=Sulfitobacter undariae TaxID=1563671 RepID=A0A7W6ED98_9RHOB|nr:hypothetical protein [Sulfitobacter undariae]MBB3995669.1 hypothetical protein [Sulfitobacter undariae]
MISKCAFFLFAMYFVLCATMTSAEMPAPSGPVVLSISGQIGVTNVNATAQFDVDMLEAFPQHETRTETPWHEGESAFSGPLLATLMDAVKGEGDVMQFKALNDYVSTIPVEEIHKYPLILATRVNGARITVRNKGPLIVIYPFSDMPELYNEMTFSRSAWQVVSIEIK